MSGSRLGERIILPLVDPLHDVIPVHPLTLDRVPVHVHVNALMAGREDAGQGIDMTTYMVLDDEHTTTLTTDIEVRHSSLTHGQ